MDDDLYEELLELARLRRWFPDRDTHEGREFLIRVVTAQAGWHVKGKVILRDGTWVDEATPGAQLFSRDTVHRALRACKWDYADATFSLMGRS